ncbi:hypothetical protein Tco_0814050 [Tanacetum coccineum]
MTSTTKTKAAKYDDIQGIEGMVLTASKYDVYSTKRIIAVSHVKVMKLYNYGHLEEIKVRREDKKLYKFKECDFPRPNLHDIKEMLLLLMFTRRVVILKRVEDLLGVESYQKKLNITRPETFRTILHNITSNLRIDYLPKRRWSKLDSKRSRIMIKATDQQLFKMRLMGNLEKFVGGRDYREDLRLLERTT